MVVPVSRESGSAQINLGEIKRFMGNNLQLRFSQNTCTMVVIGNNCSLNISENFGVVQVIGNNCVVDIAECEGTVHYTGNNGTISFGSDVRSDAVTYTGTNGNIISKKNGKSSAAKETSNNQMNNSHFSRTIAADEAILVINNVRIRNPCVKADFIDAFLPFTLITN